MEEDRKHYQFQPGHSASRPRGTSMFRAILDAELSTPGFRSGETRLHDAVRKFVDLCVAGNVVALRELIQRLDGKVPDVVRVDVDDAVTLEWPGADLQDAGPSSGPDADSQESSSIQTGHLRPPVGEDEVGSA